MSIMEIKQVGYSYDNKKKVLKGVNAEMEQGKLYAILGPSGCGKTTLLSLIGGLDSPGSGQIYFDGQDIAKTGLSDHRKNHVAFIFQAYNLIDYLTPTENVSLTSKLPPLPILERLGLTKEEARNPGYHIEPEHVAHPANISVWYIAQSAKSPASEYPMI